MIWIHLVHTTWLKQRETCSLAGVWHRNRPGKIEDMVNDGDMLRVWLLKPWKEIKMW